MKNAYSELPEVPFKRTSIAMDDIVSYMRSLEYVAEVKRAVYIIFRNESANGKKGVNDNYAGIQADGSRWPEKWDSKIIATTVKKENMTGNERRFVVFKNWTDSVDFLVDRAIARGLYIGGYTPRIAKMNVKTTIDFGRAYYKEWITGDAKAEPDDKFLNSIMSMYRQASLLFK